VHGSASDITYSTYTSPVSQAHGNACLSRAGKAITVFCSACGRSSVRPACPACSEACGLAICGRFPRAVAMSGVHGIFLRDGKRKARGRHPIHYGINVPFDRALGPKRRYGLIAGLPADGPEGMIYRDDGLRN